MSKQGLDSPVGFNGNQSGKKIWPGHWVDVNPIGRIYRIGTKVYFHNAADLNNNVTFGWDSDRFANVFAIDDGVVTHAGVLGGTWGNVVTIKHDVPGFGKIIARYAHLDRFDVHINEKVARGQVIGRIGDAFGQLPAHLHFDLVVKPKTLSNNPGHWPGSDFAAVVKNYVEPRSFIELSRPGKVWPGHKKGYAISPVTFRTGPSTSYAIYKTLLKHEQFIILNQLEDWKIMRLGEGEYGWCHQDFVAEGKP